MKKKPTPLIPAKNAVTCRREEDAAGKQDYILEPDETGTTTTMKKMNKNNNQESCSDQEEQQQRPPPLQHEEKHLQQPDWQQEKDEQQLQPTPTPTQVQPHHRVVLGDNDVLLGRGTGSNDYIGNIRYRKLVRQVLARACRVKDPPEELVAAVAVADATNTTGTSTSTTTSTSELGSVRHESTIACCCCYSSVDKAIMARQIVQTIQARGGRFLEPVSARPTVPAAAAAAARAHSTVGNIAASGPAYREVNDAVSIDKTKQSFRHQIKAFQQNGMRVAPEQHHPSSSTSSTCPNHKKRQREEDGERMCNNSCADQQNGGDDPVISAAGLDFKYRHHFSRVKQEPSAGDIVDDVKNAFLRTLASTAAAVPPKSRPRIVPGLGSPPFSLATHPCIEERLLALMMTNTNMPPHPPTEAELHKAILLQLMSLKRMHQLPPVPVHHSLRLLLDQRSDYQSYPCLVAWPPSPIERILLQQQSPLRSSFIPSWSTTANMANNIVREDHHQQQRNEEQEGSRN